LSVRLYMDVQVPRAITEGLRAATGSPAADEARRVLETLR
jgi:hypothetical protein